MIETIEELKSAVKEAIRSASDSGAQSYREIADSVGISTGSLTRIIHGDQVSLDIYFSLADHFTLSYAIVETVGNNRKKSPFDHLSKRQLVSLVRKQETKEKQYAVLQKVVHDPELLETVKLLVSLPQKKRDALLHLLR